MIEVKKIPTQEEYEEMQKFLDEGSFGEYCVAILELIMLENSGVLERLKVI